jgi:molybdate transport system ATP-binding protein
MTIEVDVSHRLGRFSLAAKFTAENGVTALFGRSGAGKTSLVNVIAGLLRPDRGRVVAEGQVLIDTERGVFVPPHRRRIGYVFQEARLFPHLTVRQNLLYGRWFTPKAARREKLDHVVELLGLGALTDRRPAGLSGGEKQRVAVGRALLTSPRLLLMDEPLASLDAARKDEILPYIERLRDEVGIPIVYVSHAVAEVARLATTVVLLSGGQVEAVGPVASIMGRLDLAPFAGDPEAGAVIEAIVAAHDHTVQLTTLEAAVGTLRVPRLALPVGARIRVRIRARDVIVAVQQPGGLSALNVLAARVTEIGAGTGPVVELRLDCHGATLLARVTRQSVQRLALTPGRHVYAVVKSIAFDRDSVGAAAIPHGEE